MSRVPRGLGRAASAASDQAVALGYVSGWRLVRLLPEPAARRLFDRIADQVYRRDPRAVQRLRANLDRVVGRPVPEALVHEAVRSYLRYWCESFRLPSWPTGDLVARTRVSNEDTLRRAYAEGRGVVVALPHMGNWDWAGAWACATGMPLVTVAERLRPERLYDEFVAYRRSLGMEILGLGDAAAFRRLQQWVGDGGLACLLADRDLGRTGVPVTLRGHQARMPRGPAVLAQRTGAALLPVTMSYDGPDLAITIHDPVPHVEGEDGVAAMMQQVADVFGEAFAAHPADWHMMQKVFVGGSAPALRARSGRGG